MAVVWELEVVEHEAADGEDTEREISILVNPGKGHPRFGLKLDETVTMGQGSLTLKKSFSCSAHQVEAVRKGAKGRTTYSLIMGLGERYKVGTKFGHRVKPPEEENDPIKRILRKFNIPVGDPKVFEGAVERYLDVMNCESESVYCPGAGDYWDNWEYKWVIKHDEVFADGDIEGEEEIDFLLYYGGSFTISNASVIVICHIRQVEEEPEQRWISEILIKDGCDPEVLKRQLIEAQSFLAQEPEEIRVEA